MTRHPKLDVNEKAIKEIGRNLEKSQLVTFISETFTKQDMVDAIVAIWNQRNLSTNDKIEKYINRNFVKKDSNGQD